MSNPDDFPITLEPTPHRVVVRLDGLVVADTTSALTLHERNHADRQYIPIEDVKPEFLQPSDRGTFCPFKGDASYYDLVTPERTVPAAVWTYREPLAEVLDIAGKVAFYPENVEHLRLLSALLGQELPAGCDPAHRAASYPRPDHPDVPLRCPASSLVPASGLERKAD